MIVMSQEGDDISQREQDRGQHDLLEGVVERRGRSWSIGDMRPRE